MGENATERLNFLSHTEYKPIITSHQSSHFLLDLHNLSFYFHSRSAYESESYMEIRAENEFQFRRFDRS